MLSDAQIIADIARQDRLSAIMRLQKKNLGPADLQRLRAELGVTAARWLMEFVAVQAKATDKLGPGVWLATDRAVQQATDQATASYKATRFPSAASIYDVCCGIGGDGLALRQRGAVVAVDSDPVIAAMAAANLSNGTFPHGAAIVCTTAEQLQLTAARNFLHIDPDRRPADLRTTQPEHYQPGLSVVERLIGAAAGAAVKLAPAARLPASWRNRCQQEWISQRGSVRQQVAWFGDLMVPVGTTAAGSRLRMATRVDSEGTAHSFAADDWQQFAESTDEVCQWIVDLDGAVRAAGLSAALANRLGAQAIGEPSGFFTSANRPAHPLATAYRVLWSGPGDVKQMKRAAADLHVKLMEIKIRGTDHRPETLRGRLADKRTREAPSATLLVGRRGANTYAVIGNRA